MNAGKITDDPAVYGLTRKSRRREPPVRLLRGVIQEGNARPGPGPRVGGIHRVFYEACRNQLRLTPRFLPFPALLFFAAFLVISALALVAFVSLLALPLVALGIGETLPLMALGPLSIRLRHPSTPFCRGQAQSAVH